MGAWGRLLEVLKQCERESIRGSRGSARLGSSGHITSGGSSGSDSSGGDSADNITSARAKASGGGGEGSSPVSSPGVRAYVLHSCNSMPAEMARAFLALVPEVKHSPRAHRVTAPPLVVYPFHCTPVP